MIKKFIEFLGIEDSSSNVDSSDADTESVRRIIVQLDSLDPATAHYMALFASILSRVGHADLNISEPERLAIEQIVKKLGGVNDATAALIAEIAKNQNKLLGGVENYLITRAFKEIATNEQKFELMEALFAVAAAEEGISSEENQEILKISEEIGLARNDFLAVRSKFKEHLNVLKSDG